MTSTIRRNDLLESSRLRLRELGEPDAGFIARLLNDADFLQFIGDRGVRTEAEACTYLADGPVRSYREHGFGLLLVEQSADHTPVGICGLVRRAGLDAPDLGFAFMPEFRGQGYALEAANLALRHAFEGLGIDRIVAIAAADNLASIRLLEKLGMKPRGQTRLPEDDKDLLLFELHNPETASGKVAKGTAVSGSDGE